DEAERKRLLDDFPGFGPAIAQAEADWAERTCKWCEEELQKMAPADSAAFGEHRWARRLVKRYFPAPGIRLDQAEQAWLDKSAVVWVEALGKLPVQNHGARQQLRKQYAEFPRDDVGRAERAWLERAYAGLKPGDAGGLGNIRQSVAGHMDLWPGAADFTRPWEIAWADRTTQAALADSGKVAKENLAAASALVKKTADGLVQLGDFPDAQRSLTEERRRLVGLRLDVVRRQVLALIAKDQYRQAAELTRKLDEDLLPE